MVKIKTYANSVNGVNLGNQGSASGFSGGQIQVASKSPASEVGSVLNKLYANKSKIKEVNNRQEAILWVGENFNTLHKNHTEWEEEFKKTDETKGGKGFTTKSLEKMMAFADEMLLKAPNKDAENLWKQKINQYKLQVFNSATQHEATMQLFEQKTQLSEITNGFALTAVKDPENFDTIIADFDKILDGLDIKGTEKIEGYTNIWNQKTLGTEKKSGKSYIATTMIQGVIDSGDKTRIDLVKSMIESGKFDKIIEADKLISLKNKINGVKNQIDAGEKFNFKVKMDDNIAAMETNGEVTHDLAEADIEFYTGKGGVAEYKYLVGIAQSVHSELSKVSMMNANEASGYIAELPTDTKANILIKSKVEGHFQNMAKLMNHDPISFTQTYRKDIYEKLNSDNNSIKQDGIGELKNLQKLWGILPSDIRVLSLSEISSLTEMFTNPAVNDAQNVQALVTQLKADYGDYFDDAIQDLIQHGKLNANVAAALMYSNDIDFPGILIAARLKIDTTNLDQTLVTDTTNEIKTLFMPVRDAVVSSNIEAIKMVDGWQNLLEKKALSLIAQDSKLSYKDAADRVFKEMITDKFLIGEHYIIPRQSTNYDDISDLTAAADIFVTKLKEQNLEVLMMGDAIMDTQTGWLSTYQKNNLEANVQWRNTADGTGIELVYNFSGDTYPVKSTGDNYDYDAGGPVTLTWENLDAIASYYKTTEKRKDDDLLNEENIIIKRRFP